MIKDPYLYFYYGMNRVRGKLYTLLRGKPFFSVGKSCKIFGLSSISIGSRFSMGDSCWLQAITQYKGAQLNPKLSIGDDVSLSDSVHISCALNISIGSGSLIGSSVYIGDHSHGRASLTLEATQIPPAKRPLDDFCAIKIGERVWIGDGVKILAGAVIPDGSVVAANSIVKTSFKLPGLIAGVPAKQKRIFFNEK